MDREGQVLSGSCKGVFQEADPNLLVQEIKKKFGIPFISFLKTDFGTAKANIPTHSQCLDMPWAERAFLMDALDALQPRPVRAGGRRAYLSLFGGKDWAAEKETTADKLAATCS